MHDAELKTTKQLIKALAVEPVICGIDGYGFQGQVFFLRPETCLTEAAALWDAVLSEAPHPSGENVPTVSMELEVCVQAPLTSYTGHVWRKKTQRPREHRWEIVVNAIRAKREGL